MRLLRAWRNDANSNPDTAYVETVDGIRVLAILMVAWFHIWQQSWLYPQIPFFGGGINMDPLVRSGYMWVDIMILVSGFCLYLPWTRLGKLDPSPDIRTFYKKRLARIHPSNLLAVLLGFLIALVQGKYSASEFAVRDLVTHLTYTEVFFYDTYYMTAINAALWTLAVEAHFYLIFPALGRLFRRAPYVVSPVMILAGLLVRFSLSKVDGDIGIYFNRLPAYLDVFGLGMLSAELHGKLAKRRHSPVMRVLCSILAVLAVYGLVQLGKAQAGCSGTEAIRLGQMQHRFAMGVFGSVCLISTANAGWLVRKIFGNPLTHFLASISMQFYIWHQVLTVWILQAGIVPSRMENPNYNGDTVWQVRFTLVAVIASLLLATVLTYAFEKPIAKRILNRKGKKQ